MQTVDILKLRPTEETPAAIRDALTRIEAAASQADAAVVTATAFRNELLLKGSIEAIRTAEADLAEHRINQEQLSVLGESVKARLPAAIQAEKTRRIAAAVEDANARQAAFEARMRKEYAPAASVLASLAQESAAVTAARSIATHMIHNAMYHDAAMPNTAVAAYPVVPTLFAPGLPAGSLHELLGHLPGIVPPGQTVPHDSHIRHWPAPVPPAPPRAPRPETPAVTPRPATTGQSWTVRRAKTPVPADGSHVRIIHRERHHNA